MGQHDHDGTEHRQGAVRRRPDFARGQRLEEPGARVPDFARGERHGEPDEYEGTFASGPDEAPVILPDHGDFARGQRRVDPN
jgi:hypothetical protein